MGWAKKMSFEAEKIKKGNSTHKGRGSNKSMGVVIYDNPEQWARLLKKFHISLRLKVLRDGTHQGAKVIAKEIQDRAPNSVASGTRAHWNRETKEKRANNAYNLKRSIKARKMRQRPQGTTSGSMAGPGRPWGNISNVIENGGNVLWWGKKGSGWRRLPPRPFLRPAFDSTQQQQRQAVVRYVIKKWTEA